MNTLELVANKIQSILGNKYAIIPFAKLQTNYTEAREVIDGDNHGYANQYNDAFTELSKRKTIGIMTFQGSNRANASYYYLASDYSIQFRVATNTTISKLIAIKTNEQGIEQKIERTGNITFFNDIENLTDEIINNTLNIGDYRAKLTVNEPIFRGKEFDGELEFAIFEVGGRIVIGDNQVFGSDGKIEFLIAGNYVELDNVNNYTETLDNNGVLIMEEGSTKGKQGSAQTGWVCSFSIDAVRTENLARLKIYEIIHLNKEIIDENSDKPRKLRVKITSPYGDVHIFDALVSITYTSTKNGVPSYNIALIDDNYGI